MPENGLEARIARLREEVGRLSAKHAERFARNAPAEEKSRELATKRAQILARRARQLDVMLGALRQGRPEQPSVHTPSHANAAVR